MLTKLRNTPPNIFVIARFSPELTIMLCSRPGSRGGCSDYQKVRIESVPWNQECGCFCAGTSNGFRIFKCDAFKETFRRDVNSVGFWIVEMMLCCNIFAIVGGSNVQYPFNRVMISVITC
jgi:hypothetical protein